jgi:hypothetical protein
MLLRLGTKAGSKLASLSLGTLISAVPKVFLMVLLANPLRELELEEDWFFS